MTTLVLRNIKRGLFAGGVASAMLTMATPALAGGGACISVYGHGFCIFWF